MIQIGILQLTQNLDDAVRGFKTGLAELNVTAQFHYCNADGNLTELPKLAKKLAGLSVDLIFACSTPAAQAAKDLADEIPVIFTPVFDPLQAKLVDSLEKPSGKVTGMSGMVAASAKINFIEELLPQAKKIGVLYHMKDGNSLIEIENFRQAAHGHFALAELPVNTPEDLSLLEERLDLDLDALFLPIGRIIEENFSSIAYYTDARNIPIITSHAPNVALGALGALTANHMTLGRACARQAKKILIDKQSISTVPVGITESPEILLNAFVADNLGITFANTLTAKAKEIYA